MQLPATLVQLKCTHLSLSIQLFAFPWISKCLGYRWTFQLGMLLYVAATVVLPFSNQITGPIPVPAATSGSGSGSGSENYTDYCGNDISAELSVNVDSVKRIPVYVWVLLTAVLGIQIMSRYRMGLPPWFTHIMLTLPLFNLTDVLLFTHTCKHMYISAE